LYQKEKRAKPGNLPKSHAISEIRGQWIEENLQSFFFYQFRIVESFVFGILIEHCVAVAFFISGRFRKGFA